jgi:RNA polymerase sigma-70 factor (ECF subfamily)
MGKELRPKLDSMDVVQDALIHALGGIADFTYQNEGDFVRWLSKIAENALHDNRDRLYAQKRDVRREVSPAYDGQRGGSKFSGVPGPVVSTTPSVMLSKKEDLARLEKAIDALRPEYKEVIVLNKIEGLGYQQIADRLGKSSEAVRKLTSRAMTALINVFESVK